MFLCLAYILANISHTISPTHPLPKNLYLWAPNFWLTGLAQILSVKLISYSKPLFKIIYLTMKALFWLKLLILAKLIFPAVIYCLQYVLSVEIHDKLLVSSAFLNGCLGNFTRSFQLCLLLPILHINSLLTTEYTHKIEVESIVRISAKCINEIGI